MGRGKLVGWVERLWPTPQFFYMPRIRDSDRIYISLAQI